MRSESVGNQLPILLIDFKDTADGLEISWESVTNPLDRLPDQIERYKDELGISYQSS